jgi:O-antigen/teichoic acid export membrane protein
MQAKIDQTNYHGKLNNHHMSFKNSRKFSYVLTGKIISSGLQSLFYLIFASILSPESYGNLSYLIAIAGTFSMFSRFGSNQTITIFQAKEKFVFAYQLNSIVIIFTTIISIYLLTIDYFVAILCFSMTIFIMNIHNLIGLKKYKQYMMTDLFKGIIIISLPIVFYFILDLPGILLGVALSYLIPSYPVLKFFKIKKDMWFVLKNHSKIIIHNFGVDVSLHAPKLVDKLVIFPILGFTSLGIYQLNLQILFALEIIPLALHSFLLSEESSGFRHKKISYFVIIISIIAALLVILLSPFLINELFPQYSDGIFSLQIMILSIIPLSIISIFNARLQSRGSTKIGFSVFIRIGLLLTLLFILGNSFGLIGLSVAVLASTIFHVIFLSILIYLDKK